VLSTRSFCYVIQECVLQWPIRVRHFRIEPVVPYVFVTERKGPLRPLHYASWIPGQRSMDFPQSSRYLRLIIWNHGRSQKDPGRVKIPGFPKGTIFIPTKARLPFYISILPGRPHHCGPIDVLLFHLQKPLFDFTQSGSVSAL
jgi:hypothetical protein